MNIGLWIFLVGIAILKIHSCRSEDYVEFLSLYVDIFFCSMDWVAFQLQSWVEKVKIISIGFSFPLMRNGLVIYMYV